MRSEVCARCDQEVRSGIRDGVNGWWHRQNVDHETILGQMVTPEMLAERDRQSHTQRQRTTDAGEVQTYTAHMFGLKDDALKQAQLEADEVVDTTYPEPELRATPADPGDFPPRSGIRQILNLLPKQGWELVRLTKARGPYIGADGSVLSISDSVVLGARGPVRLDGTHRVGVLSWRDGKFDSAYAGTVENGQITTTGVNATQMKAWIKGTDETQALEHGTL